MNLRTHLHRAALAAGILGLASCGGSSSPTAPSYGGSGSGAAPSGATITIGSDGAVSPVQVTISVGQSVTFVNNDSKTHDMASDPHPAHTDCPAIAAAGNLTPGQTKNTGAFTTARTCGFHDHNNPGNAALMGSIVIR